MSTLKTNRIENLTTTDGGISIDNSGNVGIGTTTPGAVQHVVSADNSSTQLLAGATSLIRQTGHLNAFGGPYIEATNTAQSAYQPLGLNGSYLSLGTGGSERMRIDSSGNAGIGTASPTARLDVRRDDTDGLIAELHQSGGYGIDIGSSQSVAYISSGYVQSLAFKTDPSSGQIERARIDSSGRLLINHTADTAPSGFESKLQLCDTSYQGSSLLLRRDSNDASAPHLLFAKSRSSSKGGSTVVQTNDICGRILWFAADGTDANNQVAYVDAVIDVGPSTDDTPGRLVFGTTSDSTRAASERMRITSSGHAKHSNNANYYNSGAAFHEFNQSIAAQNTIFNSTHSSYGATHVALHVSRAATTAYWFLQGVSGSGSSNDTEFYIRGDGNAFADGSWSGGGADYAEYFEWSDSNTEAEDRRGISVVLDGDKIREAVAGEEPIGVISGNPSVVGDADVDRWKGKYLRDDFGTYIQEDYEVEDDDGNTVVQQRRKLNPDYNPDTEYVSREDRPEWDCVGLMGKLRIRKGQVTGSRWIKMKDISDSVEEWLVR